MQSYRYVDQTIFRMFYPARNLNELNTTAHATICGVNSPRLLLDRSNLKFAKCFIPTIAAQTRRAPVEGRAAAAGRPGGLHAHKSMIGRPNPSVRIWQRSTRVPKSCVISRDFPPRCPRSLVTIGTATTPRFICST